MTTTLGNQMMIDVLRQRGFGAIADAVESGDTSEALLLLTLEFAEHERHQHNIKQGD